MFGYKYLSREHLEGFDNYKYMAIDTSPLSVYVMHPFWNKVVEFVPKWVAPNVLTFGGFLLVVLNFLLLSYYDYDYYAASTPKYNETIGEVPLNGHMEVIPQSLWYFIGVFLFLAYTLDGIDGKQARRTQTSGPLGELFDHGLDSYTVFYIPACLYSIFGRQDYSIPPIRIYYVMWNLLLNFYISHWEKYNTGVLFLPWGYDFSMWASTGFFLWTGVKGTSFYKKFIFAGYTLANVFEVLIYATGVVTNLPVALYNIYRSYKLRTGKMRSPIEALRPLWSFLTVFLVCSVWVHKSSHLPDYDLRALFLLIGTLFSNVAANARGEGAPLSCVRLADPGEYLFDCMQSYPPPQDRRDPPIALRMVKLVVVCRLIVSQMSNQRCDAVSWLLWPLTAAASISLLLPEYEVTAFYAVTLLTVLAHIHYGGCVVRQMCDHFRISCFYIKQRSD